MIIQGGTIRGGSIRDSVISSALYPFTTFNFTNGNSVGNTGPTISQLNYSSVGNTWVADTNYFNVVTRGIQLWTVPETASYNITVAGAGGGNNLAGAGTGNIGGAGALITTTVSLTQGQQLAIVVGQRGQDRSNVNSQGLTLLGASGGGGTFVYDLANVIYYAVAGGGGGAGIITNNFSGNVQNARYDTQNGGNVIIGSGFYANGGLGGLGGNTSSRNIIYGGPGAGVLGRGVTIGQSANVGLAGQGRAGNWLGGNAGTRSTFVANTLLGGFGGGGSAGIGDNSYTSGLIAGGGGGYSGGGAGGNSGASNASNGGGGGSYYAGILVNGVSGANFGNGYVVITKV